MNLASKGFMITHIFFMLLVFPFLLGTTFIIKEGGVEVGRWEEPDGSDKVEIIENDTVRPAPKAATVETVATHHGSARRGGGTKQKVVMPEEGQKVAQWKVSGKLVDVLTLKRLTSGSIMFKGPPGIKPVYAKVSPNGGFSARLTAIEDSGYTIAIIPPEGYTQTPHVSFKRSLSEIPYRERLSSRMSVNTLGSNWINKSQFDFEIGLFTSVQTKKEKEDYQRIVLGRRS